MSDDLTPEKSGTPPTFAKEYPVTEEKATPAPEAIKEEPKKGGMFGITTETKSSNLVPIPAPYKLDAPSKVYTSGWHFPIARLVNVISNPELEKKDGTTVPVLQFVFKTEDGKQYTHTEWKTDSDDPKFKNKLEALNTRVKHIWEESIGQFPKEGIGIGANSFTEYFNMIADAFNSREHEGKKVYSISPLFVKLVYYKGNLGFPYSPNFVERGPVNKKLTVSLKYDKIKDEASQGSLGNLAGGVPSGDSMPDFDNAYD